MLFTNNFANNYLIYKQTKIMKKKKTKAFKSKTDPLGSYTGTSLIEDNYPVQDADDL